MKRIQLFEFEDQSWFPSVFRTAITRLLNLIHRLIKTEDKVSGLLLPLLTNLQVNQVIDLCSGSGGCMPGVIKKIREHPDMNHVSLELTDLYPDLRTAEKYNDPSSTSEISYKVNKIDATQIKPRSKSLCTMICSFHHMNQEQARTILQNAYRHKQPILIYEISENSAPLWLSWTAIPINIILCFFLTLGVRPLTLPQVLFTYLIPVIPLFYAWDGAVSNARTYGLGDLDILLDGLSDDSYEWKKGLLEGRIPGLYLIGKPK